MFGLFKQERSKGKRNEEIPLENEGLPDSYRPSGLCPRCNKQSSFEIMGSLPVTFSGGIITNGNGGDRRRSHSDQVTVLLCRHCNQATVVIEEQWLGDNPYRLGVGIGGVVTFRGIHWWPLPDNKLSPDIPADIADIYLEATATLTVNCPRASAVMSRRTLEAIASYFGENKGTLADRLNSMANKGLLLPTLAAWAKEVRLIGNAGAHYDPINSISNEDAQQLLSFIRELLKYLFELPAELNRRRNQNKP